jgi:hypothetical protein
MFKSRNEVTGLCQGGSNLQPVIETIGKPVTNLDLDSFDEITDTKERSLIFELGRKPTTKSLVKPMTREGCTDLIFKIDDHMFQRNHISCKILWIHMNIARFLELMSQKSHKNRENDEEDPERDRSPHQEELHTTITAQECAQR